MEHWDYQTRQEIESALLAMPDREGSITTINGVSVERTGIEGWQLGCFIGRIKWAAQEIAKRSIEKFPSYNR